MPYQTKDILYWDIIIAGNILIRNQIGNALLRIILQNQPTCQIRFKIFWLDAILPILPNNTVIISPN